MRAVREAIAEAVSQALPDYIFDYGRKQDINKYSRNATGVDRPELLVWLFPLRVTSGANSRARLNRTFQATIAFLGVDTVHANNIESNAIQEFQFDNCERVLIQLYLNAEADVFEPEQNYTIDPVFKDSAVGVYTGVQLTLSIKLPDSLQIC